jgi:PleD family two-component response regulator
MGAAADGVSCNATSRTEVATFGKTACGARQPSSERRNVLVVDDVYLNRIVLGKLLASFGFVVTYSSDGQEAVDTFLKRKESNEDFFMILMVRI